LLVPLCGRRCSRNENGGVFLPAGNIILNCTMGGSSSY
jgi:hypothetical protein